MSSYTVSLPVSGQQIADLMITALESGSRYWLPRAEPFNPDPYMKPWYADPAFWDAADFMVTFHELVDETTDKTEPHIICLPQLQEGLERLGQKRPDLFAKVITTVEDYPDAGEADAALQLIVLGEIRYG